MSYPFRFYGRQPREFHEGANDGHVYEVAFEGPLSVEQKRRLATLFEQTFAAGAARASSDPWLWSGRFVRFAVGERWLGAWRDTFAAVARFLVNATRFVPVRQVFFFGARQAGTSDWDRWSETQQPIPDAGPAYPQPLDPAMLGYPRTPDRSLSVATPDTDVEDTRKAVRVALRDSKMTKQLAKASKKAPIRPFSADRAEAHWAAKPSLPTELQAVFDVPSPAFEQRKRKHGRSWKAHVDGDRPGYDILRPWAHTMREGYPRGLAYIGDDGRRHEVTDVPQDQWRFHNLVGPWTSADGRTLYFAIGNRVFRVDVALGRAELVFEAQAKKVLAVLLLDTVWVCKTDHELILVDPHAGFTAIETHESHGHALDGFFDGSLLLVTDTSNERFEAWGRRGSKLAQLHVYDVVLFMPQLIDGTIVCRVPGHKFVALDGLREKLDSWASGQTDAEL